MRAVSRKRGRENTARRKMVATLSYWCEAQLEGCTHLATDPHEILTRGRGGSIVDRTNVVPVCRRCHDQITALSGTGQWAERHGWVLSSWSTEMDRRVAASLRSGLRCAKSCRIDHRDGHLIELADGTLVVMEQGRGA